VAGCLEAAPAAPIGTSGAPPAAGSATDTAAKTSDAAKLVLTNAVASPAQTAGTSDATAPMTYGLIVNETALVPHIGKKLELAGTVEEPSATAPAANGPMLRVEAAKIVAESCTP